ncbi:MAG: nitroreductase family protein [Leptolyngbyaceae cyanobacterium T60_A2020_046]|nr:nitroreductase family protein [Leptolyngbyaceae cyanobacterium T60_A2020_046]
MSTTPAFLDVATAVRERRAIKHFKADPIAPEVLSTLVELTVAAPSSYNLQDWHIVLVQEEAQRQALAEAAFGQAQVSQAPVTAVFAADAAAWKDEDRMAKIYETGLQSRAWTPKTVDYFKTAIPQFMRSLGPKTREYAIKNAMIAATHMALVAQAMGLSSCFLNGWDEDKVKAVIGAENQPALAIAVLLPIGYAAEPRQNPGRLPFEVNVSVDRLATPYHG